MTGARTFLAACLASMILHAGATPFAVTARTGSTVGIIDIGINLTVATIPGFTGTDSGIALVPGGNFFYVADALGNLRVIDATDYQVVATIPLGGSPSSLAINPAGTRVYASLPNIGKVAVVDTASNTVVATVDLGNFSLAALAVRPTGSEVYVAKADSSGTVAVIETAGNTLMNTIAVGGLPEGVAISPDGTRVYVANFFTDNISVIDTVAQLVSATWSSCDGPLNLAVAPGGGSLYVSCGNGTAVVHDTTTGAMGAVAAGLIGFGYPVQADPAGALVYFAGQDTFHTTDTALVEQQSTGAIFTNILVSNQFISSRPDATMPQAYSFAAQAGTALSTTITSAPAFITKINTRTGVSVSGAGAYCVSSASGCACDVQAFGTAAGTILPNQYVCLQHTSSALPSTGTSTIVTVGGVAATFTSTTSAIAPGAPTGVIAVAGNASATVAFAAPASDGGSAITGYTVTSVPPGGTDIDAGSTSTSHTITGLTNGTAYTFTVTATNAAGTSASSTASNSVTPPLKSFTGPTATGTGSATVSFVDGGGTCSFAPQGTGVMQSAFFIPVTGSPKSPPAGSAPPGVTFPQGLLDFVIVNCSPGDTVDFTITYPTPLPVGTQYWKYGPTAANTTPHWYLLPATIAGNTATFSITDGGLGDDDRTIDGTIMDQGGPGGGPPGGAGGTGVPTLSEWALMLLALLVLAGGAWTSQRR